MLGQSYAPVLSFRSALLLPVFVTGRARPLMVTFVFYDSNLSWNTNDDTLRLVRLIFFLALPALSVPDSELPRFFFMWMMAYCQ